MGIRAAIYEKIDKEIAEVQEIVTEAIQIIDDTPEDSNVDELNGCIGYVLKCLNNLSEKLG